MNSSNSMIGLMTDDKQIDPAVLCKRLMDSAEQVMDFLQSKLESNGSFGQEAKDIACYYKSPMLFITGNRPDIAKSILSHIHSEFMTANGDFKTSSNVKSANNAYVEFWSYTNGWIVRAAHQLGFSQIVEFGSQYLQQYFFQSNGGFLTNDAKDKNGVTDVLTTAHHGLLNLEMGNMDLAISAGHYLCEAIKRQPDMNQGFYLRFDSEGKVISQYEKSKSMFNYVSTIEPNQLHFMIGYPAAYLGLLYQKTKNVKFLEGAKVYLEFSLNCHESVFACNFSHKLAWAASIIYAATGEERYLRVIDRITKHFIANQKNGMWYLSDGVNAAYDQSAEIACWFLDIIKNINMRLNKTFSPVAMESAPSHQKSWKKNIIKYGPIALAVGVGLYALYRSKGGKTTVSHDTAVDFLSLNRIG